MRQHGGQFLDLMPGLLPDLLASLAEPQGLGQSGFRPPEQRIVLDIHDKTSNRAFCRNAESVMAVPHGRLLRYSQH
jgi:hypothetical protein